MRGTRARTHTPIDLQSLTASLITSVLSGLFLSGLHGCRRSRLHLSFLLRQRRRKGRRRIWVSCVQYSRTGSQCLETCSMCKCSPFSCPIYMPNFCSLTNQVKCLGIKWFWYSPQGSCKPKSLNYIFKRWNIRAEVNFPHQNFLIQL